jgi:hypothetical protein
LCKEFTSLADHVNCIAEDPTTEVGPVIVSFEWEPSRVDNQRKAYMRTKKVNTNNNTSRINFIIMQGIQRFLVPEIHCSSVQDMIKYTKGIFPEVSAIKLAEVAHPELPKCLVDYERKDIVRHYKFGILYVKEGQTDENDMFGNNDTSEQFDDFLHWIGERVKLQGWTGYRGGLDVKNNSTGTESVHTMFGDGLEIMFHVCTLLPYQPDDLQKVERKRYQ